MKALSLALLLSALAACTNYSEPQANCFAFVTQYPAPMDCDFESLGSPHLANVAHD